MEVPGSSPVTPTISAPLGVGVPVRRCGDVRPRSRRCARATPTGPLGHHRPRVTSTRCSSPLRHRSPNGRRRRASRWSRHPTPARSWPTRMTAPGTTRRSG
ncbi:MAG: hypothetical protein ACK53Y_17385 [bacterium]